MGTRSGAVYRAQRIGRGFLRTRRHNAHRESLDDGASAPDRLHEPLRLRAYRTGVAVFIGAILVAQAAVLLPDFDTGWGGPKTWPIIGYHMYSRSRAEGQVVEARHLMEATLSDGRAVELTPEALGLTLWDYRRLTDGLIADDPDAVRLLHERYGAGAADFAELRISSFPVIVTRTGAQDAPPELVKRLALNPRQPQPGSEPGPIHAAGPADEAAPKAGAVPVNAMGASQ